SRKFRKLWGYVATTGGAVTTSNPNPNPNPTPNPTPTTERAGQAWQDTTLPYATRVDLLLAQMTVEEKVGQLGSRWTGNDMAAVGVHQGLSPVLDVVRDYRWGRVEETMGEDPYLVAMLGAAYVRGMQSAGVIATLKHFAGYPAARAGRNHAPVSMGRRELMD